MSVELARAQLFPPAHEGPALAPCFAVLDAARDEDIDRLTLAQQMRFLYLIDGVVDPALTARAPRVVELGPSPGPGLERLLAQGLGHSWGFYLRSRAPLLDVRDHLASLLVAELPDGSVVRFRLFDPRVLRVYLPTCTPAELERVFGPILCFLVEPEQGEGLECFARDAEGELCDSWCEGQPNEAEGPPRLRLDEQPLQLREAQVEALSGRARASFEARMLAHLRRFFPTQCETLGEVQTRAMLAHGVERATHYGFVSEAEICKYLNLMFGFGRNFDRQQAWARALLGAARRGDDSLMERLYSLALVNEARALGRV